MADVPGDLRYTESDEWVRQDGDEMTLGITAYAAEQLGDVVYLQLPEVGAHFDQGATFGEIESVKAVSDLFMPVSGEVTAVNDALDSTPALANEDSYGEGWLLRFRPDNASDYDSLLDAAAYQQKISE